MTIIRESGENKVTGNRNQATDVNRQLLELANEVSLAADFQGAMQALLEQLWDLMPCDGISVMWLDGGHLEVMASRGSTAPLRGLTLPANQVGLLVRHWIVAGRSSCLILWRMHTGSRSPARRASVRG